MHMHIINNVYNKGTLCSLLLNLTNKVDNAATIIQTL